MTEPGCCDRRYTTSQPAAAAYERGVRQARAGRAGAASEFAMALALDPTFALAHAALASTAADLGLPVDIAARVHDAQLHARRSTPWEQQQVAAVTARLCRCQAARILSPSADTEMSTSANADGAGPPST